MNPYNELPSVRRLEAASSAAFGSRRAAASAVRDPAVAVSGAILALESRRAEGSECRVVPVLYEAVTKVHAPEGAGGRARRT